MFNGKKIIIRKITKLDLKDAQKFQFFINSVIKEDAKILMNEQATLNDQKKFIEKVLVGAKNKTKVQLLAECDNKIIGVTDIELERWRRNHIGHFGIIITKDYRGMGLGKHLMSKIIKLAKKELKPSPKMIQLEVYANNKPAIKLYEKMGFKHIARLPKQIQYKSKLIDELVMLLHL